MRRSIYHHIWWSERRYQVAVCLARGWEYAVIAHVLGISLGTVKRHALACYRLAGLPKRHGRGCTRLAFGVWWRHMERNGESYKLSHPQQKGYP